jgi:hypothetical protein
MFKRVRSDVSAAEKSGIPGFIKPQLATLKSRAPVGPQWLHEIKFDGYRVQIHLNKGKRKVYTRNGWIGRSGSQSLPARSTSPDRRLSMGKSSSSTKAEPIFLSFKPNSPKVARTAWYSMPSNALALCFVGASPIT